MEAYVGVESEKELIFTGLLYLGKTPGGLCDKFQDFERISIVVVEVVVVELAIVCNYDSPIRSGYAKLFKYCRTGVIRSLTIVRVTKISNFFGFFV